MSFMNCVRFTGNQAWFVTVNCSGTFPARRAGGVAGEPGFPAS